MRLQLLIELDIMAGEIKIGSVKLGGAVLPEPTESPVNVLAKLGDPRQESVAYWLEEYEKRRGIQDLSASHSERSIHELRKAIRRLKWTTLSDITSSSIVGYLAVYKEQRRGPKTRNLIRSYLYHFCRFLVQERARTQIQVNPVESVPKAIVRRKNSYMPATKDEKDRLVAVAKSDMRKKDRWLLYEVAWWTGLRLGVLFRLTWKQLHLEDPQPHVCVPADWQKNGHAIRCELPRHVADMLAQHKVRGRGRQKVFIVQRLKGEHFDRDLAKAGLAKKDESTGQRRAFYSFRHGFQEMMRREGLDISARRLAMGHTTINMTADVYSHPSSKELREVIDRVASRAGGRPPTPSEENLTNSSCETPPVRYSDPVEVGTVMTTTLANSELSAGPLGCSARLNHEGRLGGSTKGSESASPTILGITQASMPAHSPSQIGVGGFEPQAPTLVGRASEGRWNPHANTVGFDPVHSPEAGGRGAITAQASRSGSPAAANPQGGGASGYSAGSDSYALQRGRASSRLPACELAEVHQPAKAVSVSQTPREGDEGLVQGVQGRIEMRGMSGSSSSLPSVSSQGQEAEVRKYEGQYEGHAGSTCGQSEDAGRDSEVSRVMRELSREASLGGEACGSTTQGPTPDALTRIIEDQGRAIEAHGRAIAALLKLLKPAVIIAAAVILTWLSARAVLGTGERPITTTEPVPLDVNP